MSIEEFIQQLRANSENIEFNTTIDVIARHYQYTPTTFSNGVEGDCVVNPAGTNEGSNKLFAFGQLQQLSEVEMLHCFGDYYRKDVLQNPDGSDHANIRTFMRHGWQGIKFETCSLTPLDA